MDSYAPPPEADALDHLCLQCGLCCDGTFLGHLPVGLSELAQCQRIGLRIVEDADGSLHVPQPCSALSGARCSLYVDRPAACARFECALRKRVAGGQTTLDDALAEVRRMHELVATIRSVFECPAPASFWPRLVALGAPGTDEEARALAIAYGPGLDAANELFRRGASFVPRMAESSPRAYASAVAAWAALATSSEQDERRLEQ